MHYFILGLTFGFSLIISLGPQNLFLIQQGIKKEYAWLAASLCFACDVLLITASVFGLHYLILQYSFLKSALLIGGICFLAYYGVYSVYNALTKPLQTQTYVTTGKPIKIILLTLSFSLLNPQAMIDTMLMIGGSASQLPINQQYPFVFGVITSSFFWFYTLTYTATRYANILAKKRIFQSLQFSSGILMLGLGAKLLLI